MTAKEFVVAVRTAVEFGATKGVLKTLDEPAGRAPDGRLVKLSTWYNNLSAQDRQMVADIVSVATDQATYNFLLVLDGNLAVEQQREKGAFFLTYEGHGQRVLINDPNAPELATIFKDVTPG